MTRLTFDSVASHFSVMGYELVKASKGYKEDSGYSKEKFANLQTALDWLNQQVSVAPVDTFEHPDAFAELPEETPEEVLNSLPTDYDYNYYAAKLEESEKQIVPNAQSTVKASPKNKNVLNSFESLYRQFVPKRSTRPAIGFSPVVTASDRRKNGKQFKAA